MTAWHHLGTPTECHSSEHIATHQIEKWQFVMGEWGGKSHSLSWQITANYRSFRRLPHERPFIARREGWERKIKLTLCKTYHHLFLYDLWFELCVYPLKLKKSSRLDIKCLSPHNYTSLICQVMFLIRVHRKSRCRGRESRQASVWTAGGINKKSITVQQPCQRWQFKVNGVILIVTFLRLSRGRRTPRK